jgi:hypothetical protein
MYIRGVQFTQHVASNAVQQTADRAKPHGEAISHKAKLAVTAAQQNRLTRTVNLPKHALSHYSRKFLNNNLLAT